MRATPRALLRLALLLSCGSAEDQPRHAAAAHCASRGRTLIAFGAHTDEQFVQHELRNIVDAADAMSRGCPRHDVALFVDASKQYDVLRSNTTIRVPFARIKKNATAATRAFVSHQLLMASLPAYVAEDKRYDYVWVIEEDAKLAQGSWDQLFRKFNRSEADLIAHVRRTRNGMAALLPVARLSTRLVRAIRHDLARIDNRERGAPRRKIHGAFSYQLCRGRSWCATEAIPRDWLAVYRAKCAWSGAKFERDAATWFNPTSHGLLYHPVKLNAPTSGRDFKRYNCAKTFAKELSENGRQRAQAANAARGHAPAPDSPFIDRAREMARGEDRVGTVVTSLLERFRGGDARV